MTNPQVESQARLTQAIKARAEAEALLSRLMADRSASEQRFAEAGKKDPVKMLTGTSALDRAIESTREMIDHLDSMIATLKGEASPSGGGTSGGGGGGDVQVNGIMPSGRRSPGNAPVTPAATST